MERVGTRVCVAAQVEIVKVAREDGFAVALVDEYPVQGDEGCVELFDKSIKHKVELFL